MKDKTQISNPPSQGTANEFHLESVFRENYASLVYFSYRMIGNKSDAEDLVQEAFVNYWTHRKDVPLGRTEIKNYLYKAVKNSSLNFNRHQKVVEKYENGFLPNAMEEDSIVNLIIESEVLAELYAAMSTLPGSCQLISRMSYLEGMKNQEIAAELKLSINTVKTQKQRGLQLLKKKLNGGKVGFLILFLLH